jgi:hypothetical protein
MVSGIAEQQKRTMRTQTVKMAEGLKVVYKMMPEQKAMERIGWQESIVLRQQWMNPAKW